MPPNTEVKREAGTCWRCKRSLEVSRLYVDGRPAPLAPVMCQDCLDATEVGPQRPEHGKDVRDWLLSLGVNTRKHGSATLANFDATHAPRALEAAHAFLAEAVSASRHDRVRGLYLAHEDKGSGKTHLAVAIMRQLHEARPDASVVYLAADRLVTRVQDSYGTGTTDQFIETLRLAHLVVLDDLGREKATDDALRTLCTVLDEREGAPTVITANALPHELGRRHRDMAMWDRVASRLGDAVYRFELVPGPDRRFRQGPAQERAS